MACESPPNKLKDSINGWYLDRGITEIAEDRFVIMYRKQIDGIRFTIFIWNESFDSYEAALSIPDEDNNIQPIKRIKTYDYYSEYETLADIISQCYSWMRERDEHFETIARKRSNNT